MVNKRTGNSFAEYSNIERNKISKQPPPNLPHTGEAKQPPPDLPLPKAFGTGEATTKVPFPRMGEGMQGMGATQGKGCKGWGLLRGRDARDGG